MDIIIHEVISIRKHEKGCTVIKITDGMQTSDVQVEDGLKMTIFRSGETDLPAVIIEG